MAQGKEAVVYSLDSDEREREREKGWAIGNALVVKELKLPSLSCQRMQARGDNNPVFSKAAYRVNDHCIAQ